MSKTLIIIILIIIILGLWYNAPLTKDLMTGAFAYAKELAASAGIIK